MRTARWSVVVKAVWVPLVVGVMVAPDASAATAGSVTVDHDTSMVGLVASAVANPPTLDATFSGDGVISSNLGGPDGMYGVAVQPDGNLVVVGQYSKAGRNHPLVLRYRSTGAKDATFGIRGRVNLSPRDASLSEVALQPDGKIVAAGFVGQRLLVVRLNPGGRLDRTFSGNGWLAGPQTIKGSSSAWPPLLELDSNRNIVVLANRRDATWNYQASVLRYRPSGRLDESFSTDGVRPVDGLGIGAAMGLAIDANDRVLVALAGYRPSSPRVPASVVRLTSSGRVDRTFSGDGYQQLRINTTKAGTWPLSVDVNGAGTISVGLTGATSPQIGVAQLLSDGQFDPGFAAGKGIVVRRCSVLCSVTGTMTPAGYVIYGGTYNPRSTTVTRTYLARLLPDGSGLDPTFGISGQWVRDLFPGWENPFGGSAIDSSGRLLIPGSRKSPSHQDGFVIRLDMN